MNLHTISILSEYDGNCELINIFNKNIIGILDLSNYKKFIHLNCSNNKITYLVKLLKSLTYLDCSNNQITKFVEFPKKMNEINYKLNPIKKIFYPLCKNLIKYPLEKNNVSKNDIFFRFY